MESTAVLYSGESTRVSMCLSVQVCEEGTGYAVDHGWQGHA